MRFIAVALGCALGVLALTACDARAKVDSAELTAADRAAIDSLQRRYVSAWLRDDTAAVIATFAPDGMLLPPGQRPVQGAAAIKAYWWPADGSHTSITAFNLTSDELEGAGPLAYGRGLSTLAWRYTKDGATLAQSGKNIGLTIFRRSVDGRWLIARQMWGPSLSH